MQQSTYFSGSKRTVLLTFEQQQEEDKVGQLVKRIRLEKRQQQQILLTTLVRPLWVTPQLSTQALMVAPRRQQSWLNLPRPPPLGASGAPQALIRFGDMRATNPYISMLLSASRLHSTPPDGSVAALCALLQPIRPAPPLPTSSAIPRTIQAAPTIAPTPPKKKPMTLAHPQDAYDLSPHQAYLRQNIEIFCANADECAMHTRGRNKPITAGQVGIRCRWCAHVPMDTRTKGSTYFPVVTMGLYQAAQNMSTAHLQCGLCPYMPESVRHRFKDLILTKVYTSAGGRKYWAETAKQLYPLKDTEADGIRWIKK